MQKLDRRTGNCLAWPTSNTHELFWK